MHLHLPTRDKDGTLKVAIAGTGIAGAYLYRLLSKRGIHADLYGIKEKTHCGASPCAWGTSKGFINHIEAVEFDSDKYILKRFDHLIIDDVRVPADLMTIDKPKLIDDLLEGAKINLAELNPADYHRLIDATGVSRRYLPAITDDIVLKCVQYRVRSTQALENQIKPGRVGYGWCFPVGQNLYHIGSGGLVADTRELFSSQGWPEASLKPANGVTICSCSGRVRLTTPDYSQPFFTDNGACEVLGVGESIGCVGPLAGDGILSSFKSAQLLADLWNDPEGYTEAIKNEFKWMRKERKVLKKLLEAKYINIRDARVLKNESRRMGLHVTLKNAGKLMNNLKRLFKEK
jgi:flavin-dependent dehydrogenase